MRWAMAWVCFWIGDMAYRCRWGWLHQRAMVWSDWWQGDTDKGPWKATDADGK